MDGQVMNIDGIHDVPDPDENNDGDGNGDDSGCVDGDSAAWSSSAASRLNILRGEMGDSSQRCRLHYHEPSSEIQLLPFVDGAAGDERDAGNVVLDSFDPRDVIGVELEIDFGGADLGGGSGGEEAAAATEGRGGGGDAGSEGESHSIGSTPPPSPPRATAKLNVYAYPRAAAAPGYSWPLSSLFGSSTTDSSTSPLPRRACHRSYALDSACCEDFSDARSIVRSIRRLSGLCHVLPDGGVDRGWRPTRCLVVVNPFAGGNGGRPAGGKNVYRTLLAPMFDQAGVEHHLMETERPGHARERMSERGEKGRTKVGCAGSEIKAGDSGIGDDGGTNEERAEIADVTEYDSIIAMGGDGILFEIMQGIRERKDSEAVMTKMKFGVVGCGTSNGLAKSLLHWNDEHYAPLESIFQICKGRGSPMDLSEYALANVNTTYSSFLSFSWGLIADADLESEWLRWLGTLRYDIWIAWRILWPRRYRARFSYLPPPEDDCDASSGRNVVRMPSFDEPPPSGWKVVDEDIVIFWVCQTSHASYDMFTCPMAKKNDGLFHILLVKASCSKFRVVEMLLKLGTGGHIDCKNMEVVRCLAYRLEPMSENSYNDLDGEHIESGPIQARMSPSGAWFYGGCTS